MGTTMEAPTAGTTYAAPQCITGEPESSERAAPERIQLDERKPYDTEAELWQSVRANAARVTRGIERQICSMWTSCNFTTSLFRVRGTCPCIWDLILSFFGSKDEFLRRDLIEKVSAHLEAQCQRRLSQLAEEAAIRYVAHLGSGTSTVFKLCISELVDKFASKQWMIKAKLWTCISRMR